MFHGEKSLTASVSKNLQVDEFGRSIRSRDDVRNGERVRDVERNRSRDGDGDGGRGGPDRHDGGGGHRDEERGRGRVRCNDKESGRARESGRERECERVRERANEREKQRPKQPAPMERVWSISEGITMRSIGANHHRDGGLDRDNEKVCGH